MIASFARPRIAIHGLPTFRSLFQEDLKGHRPAMKFFCIKMIVTITSYQTTLVGVHCAL